MQILRAARHAPRTRIAYSHANEESKEENNNHLGGGCCCCCCKKTTGLMQMEGQSIQKIGDVGLLADFDVDKALPLLKNDNSKPRLLLQTCRQRRQRQLRQAVCSYEKYC
eukprot:scaffold4510_cov183-Amphora_coffeaeformis.AAC.73